MNEEWILYCQTHISDRYEQRWQQLIHRNCTQQL